MGLNTALARCNLASRRSPYGRQTFRQNDGVTCLSAQNLSFHQAERYISNP